MYCHGIYGGTPYSAEKSFKQTPSWDESATRDRMIQLICCRVSRYYVVVNVGWKAWSWNSVCGAWSVGVAAAWQEHG